MRKALIVNVLVLFLWCGIAIGDLGDYPGKLWLHRCNSIEKLCELQDKYPNFEVDVVFRSKILFDVTHDEDTTFNLNLKSYFAFMQNREGRMWLDIKNLDLQNVEDVLQGLNGFTERYGVGKDRLILESSSFKALRYLTQAGYYTSFYIPYEKPSMLNEEEKSDFFKKLNKLASKGWVKALSFPGWWYSTIKENLESDIDLLTWKHRSTQFQLLLSLEGREMLDDPQLKVILVKDKGHYHR